MKEQSAPGEYSSLYQLKKLPVAFIRQFLQLIPTKISEHMVRKPCKSKELLRSNLSLIPFKV